MIHKFSLNCLIAFQDESRGETPNSNRSCDYNSLSEVNTPSKPALFAHAPNYDEEELFCLSVAARLKKFTEKTKASTMIRIQQILYDAQFIEEKNMANEKSDWNYWYNFFRNFLNETSFQNYHLFFFVSLIFFQYFFVNFVLF